MSKNTSIILGGNLESFVEDQVQVGNYASASEVIRAGLRLLAEREAKLQHLRTEIQKGVDSGVVEDFTMKGFLSNQRKAFKQRSTND